MDLSSKIREKGIKVTPQRRLVYEIMGELRHASMEAVIEKVRSANPCITVSTVYRILDSFCDAGLLSRFNHPGGKPYFDITPTTHSHIYMDTKDIIDFEDEDLTKLIRSRLQNGQFKDLDIEKISIQIFAKNNNNLKNKQKWKRKK